MKYYYFSIIKENKLQCVCIVQSIYLYSIIIPEAEKMQSALNIKNGKCLK